MALVSVAALLAVALLAHLPLILPQISGMWNSEHYSFFPFIFLAFAWLLRERLRHTDVQIRAQFSQRSLGLLLLNLMLLGLATLSNSTWLGWVSFLLLLRTASLLLLSPETFDRLRFVFLVLLIIVPLPLSLDTELVIGLQKLATAEASRLLDYVGIHHAVSGVAIRIPTKLFLIDDACSGIHSLFSSMAAMLVFAVYCRYGIVRIVLTLGQTAFWVLVVNSLRVFLVIFSFDRWNAGIETGWRHAALGFACYTLILLLAVSTDQLIRYIAQPTARRDYFGNARSAWRDQVAAWWNRPFGVSTTRYLSGGLAAVFLVVGISAALTWRSSTAMAGENFSKSLGFALAADSLPEEVQGWKRVGFESITRAGNDVFGSNSMIWTYERNGVSAQFSVDGAYNSFHDVWYCYSSIGWNLRRSDNLPLNGSVGDVPHAVATELQLYRGNDEQAYVLFTCVDAAGQVVAPPAPAETVTRKLIDRLRSGQLLGSGENRQVIAPVIQFQAFSHSDAEFFSHEMSGVRDLFSELRAAASRQIYAKSEK